MGSLSYGGPGSGGAGGAVGSLPTQPLGDAMKLVEPFPLKQHRLHKKKVPFHEHHRAASTTVIRAGFFTTMLIIFPINATVPLPELSLRYAACTVCH